MGQCKKKIFAIIVSITMMISIFSQVGSLHAAVLPEYEIYPTPHKITYKDNESILGERANVVYESGIDEYTKDRLKEVTDIKNLSVSLSNETIDNDATVTNILVGIKDSGEYVDNYVKNSGTILDTLFAKTDSYYILVNDGTIIVLGKDTDATFYGLTTLYHVFNQLESHTIRNFEIEDYADVKSRGFIEGYYGNPWSVEDRAELMKFGGYYKMNTYFYAPKDDSKHKDQWDVLYTEQEIENLIRPLAKAGNESKCSFAFALHPFGWANTFNFNNYDEELGRLKAKFKQVIDNGVRQIAILADDFYDPGGTNGLRLINDINDWLKNEVKVQYPDMKLTIPYIPYDYMGDGAGGELQILKNAPENIQLVMTGGGVWGSVNQNFTNTFTNNVGRGPFLWINWPCSDNATSRLIMGGFKEFLNPGVSPDKIQGIMLNPMEHSEPSKVGIFGNACYAWNIWENNGEADQAWQDSFKYVDHNTSLETKGSKSLREISKHMIAQNTGLDESLDLKNKLNTFRSALNGNTVTAAMCDDLIAEFETLKEAATYYKASGHARLKEQMMPWLNCWDDTMESGIAYLNGIKAVLNNDSNGCIDYNTKGSKALDDSTKHHFITKNTHDEYALVGSKYITPLIRDMSLYMSKKVESVTNPDYFGQTYITNRTDFPNGSLDNVFDGNDGTSIQYVSNDANLNNIKAGQYIGVEFSKAIEVNDIRFLLGSGKNKFEHSKLQYTNDGTNWQDVDGQVYDFGTNIGSPAEIKVEGLSITAKAIRLITTADNAVDAWLTVFEITVNKPKVEEKPSTALEIINVELENMVVAGYELNNIKDGNENTETHFKKANGSDFIDVGAAVVLDLKETKLLGTISLVQGLSEAADVPNKAIIEYSIDKTNWIKLADLSTQLRQEFNGNGAQARYVRIQNTEHKNIWWRINEITINEYDATSDNTPISYTLMKTPSWRYADSMREDQLYDGNDTTGIYFDPANNGDEGRENDISEIGDYIGYDLGKIASLASVHIVVGNGNDNDKWTDYHLEYSIDNVNWTTVNSYTSSKQKDSIDENLNGIKARYIRLVNDKRITKWLRFNEFTVEELQSGIKDYVYTNQENSQVLSSYSSDVYSLNKATFTLQQGDYVGIQLKNIKHIESFTTDASINANIKLQTSVNGIEWIDATSVNDIKGRNLRYVRIVNIGDKSTEITITDFSLKVFSIKKASFVDSNIQINAAYGDGDMRKQQNSFNIFDGNLSTEASIAGYPTQDGYVIFDLGQERKISTIRYYVKETAKNYIRDAIFEVSNDLEGSSWTSVLEIGDRIENTGVNGDGGSETDAKSYSEYIHDSINPGNMYKENIVSNDAIGRYLRVRFTAPYKDRFAQFNEIVINNNEYVTTEDTKDFTIHDIEEPGKIPSNMLDNDLSTTFKSSKKNSEFTYHISKPIGKKSIRIVQVGEISNATVEAEVYVSTRTKSIVTQTITLGTLNQAVSEFKLPDGYTFKNVTISWEDKIPELAEVMLLNTAADTTAMKEILRTILDDKKDTSTWTDSTSRAYELACNTGTIIYNNSNASLTSVESAISSIQAAIANKVIKYVGNEIEALIEADAQLHKDWYTPLSYQAYLEAIDVLKNNVDNGDLSQEKAMQFIAATNIAKANLVYTLNQRELAQLRLNNLKTYEPTSYSKVSYTAYENALQALQEAVDEDVAATTQEQRVHPNDMKAFLEALVSAESKLVDITTLNALIQEFAGYNESLYTPETYAAYKAMIDEGRQLLESGTKEQVLEIVQKINEEKAKLTLKQNVNLQEVIKEAQKIDKNLYTKDSYKMLEDAIKEALEPHDSAQNYDLAKQILDARTKLVSIEGLKAKLAEVRAFNPDKYTVSSWNKVQVLVDAGDALMINGTNKTINQMIKDLNDAVLHLENRANMDNYRSSIQLKDSSLYTKESYQAYLNAYTYLMSLSAEDTTGDAFMKAKTVFENAEAALQKKEDTKLPTDKPGVETGDTTNLLSIFALLGISSIALVSMKKRKQE